MVDTHIGRAFLFQVGAVRRKLLMSTEQRALQRVALHGKRGTTTSLHATSDCVVLDETSNWQVS